MVPVDVKSDSLIELLQSEGIVRSDQIERALRILNKMEDPLPLLELLVRLGCVTHQQIDTLVRRQRRSLSIEKILVNQGFLKQEELEKAERIAESEGRPLREVLVESGSVSERQYLLALCEKHELPLVDLDVGLIDQRLIKGFSLKYLRERGVVPLMRDEHRVACVISDPLNENLIAELETVFDSEIAISVATGSQIQSTLNLFANLDRKDQRITSMETSTLTYHDVEAGQERDNITEIVDLLIARAIHERASDIHIEPMASKMRVRFRRDGALVQVTDLPRVYGPRVTSRIKILAEADIAERRRHQDGRILVLCDGKEIDLRASFYVTVYGENTVLRILDRDKNLVSMENLGFSPKMLHRFIDDVLESSSGIVLITGPTGSGKTTTLYSSLAYCNDPTKKVITCEDPVEYLIEGIAQCSVNEKVGPTFADTLRSIVRQDPDIIVLGEVRDRVSAAIAAESALTGHKVLSTFHTEDAVSALLRLTEMGLEPYMIASTLSAILAQRLVRKICPDCSEHYNPTARELRLVGVAREEVSGIHFFRGRGCDGCLDTGYHGRLGIYELVILTDKMREAVIKRAPTHELRRLSLATDGYVTLLEDGIAKAVQGVTTFEEVLKCAPRTSIPRSVPEILNAVGESATGFGG